MTLDEVISYLEEVKDDHGNIVVFVGAEDQEGTQKMAGKEHFATGRAGRILNREAPFGIREYDRVMLIGTLHTESK